MKSDIHNTSTCTLYTCTISFVHFGLLVTNPQYHYHYNYQLLSLLLSLIIIIIFTCIIRKDDPFLVYSNQSLVGHSKHCIYNFFLIISELHVCTSTVQYACTCTRTCTCILRMLIIY